MSFKKMMLLKMVCISLFVFSFLTDTVLTP